MQKYLRTGERFEQREKSIIVHFESPRVVLSTGDFNGGLRRDLTAVFNHDITDENGVCALTEETYEKELEKLAKELGLSPAHATGMSTAVCMTHMAAVELSYEGLNVGALVTGGIDVNGGRAGDPASFCERNGEFYELPRGTINTILLIGASLPDGILARALVTATEAKVAALQELLLPSQYSSGIATGSGTDGVIAVCDPNAPLHLTNAGKHSKLGELIGRAVKEATKEALRLHTGAGPQRAGSMLRRFSRYGLTELGLFEKLKGLGYNASYPAYQKRISFLDRQSFLLAQSCAYLALMDEMMWGLAQAYALKEGRRMLDAFAGLCLDFPGNKKTSTEEAMLEDWCVYLKFLLEEGFSHT